MNSKHVLLNSTVLKSYVLYINIYFTSYIHFVLGMLPYFYYKTRCMLYKKHVFFTLNCTLPANRERSQNFG